MRIGRKKLTAGLALAAAMIFAAGAATALLPNREADAARGGDDQWVTVEELYIDEAKSFNGDNIMALIKALTGESSYSALTTAAQSKRTSADFRSQNDGKNVSVYFGGMKWDAVYLTTAKTTAGNTTAGDIILDLWRSADTLTAGDAATYSGFWSDKDPDKEDYPSNMYSTSKIRVKTLNAGGKCTEIDVLTQRVELKKHSQDGGNQYARFTIDSVDNSLTSYLAKPSEVGYQETEYDRDTMLSIYGEPQQQESGYTANYFYYFPNDAYGTPSGSDFSSEPSKPNSGGDSSGKKESQWYENMDYSNKGNGETAYDAWKDDYLWLPSLTETGMTNGSVKGNGDGMWDTDAPLRSANSGVGKGYCWLRSGDAYRADRAYFLDASGNHNYVSVSNGSSDKDSCGVRPAIHFNLSAALRTAILDKESWKGDTKTYSPKGVTWEIVDTDMVDVAPANESGDTSWWDADKKTITADRVGDYQLKVKPNSALTWKEGGADEITVTYKVVPDNMRVIFNNGLPEPFNNGKLEKRQDIVYSLSMEPIALKLPDPTDKKFPISWKDVSWYDETIAKLKIQYIVKKYEEENYNQQTIDKYLTDLKSGQDSTEWQDYDKLTDKTAQEPMHYVVYFKAEDTEGNHKTDYDYFEIHILEEKLNITLTDAAKTGFGKGVEYGDVAHTKDAFEKEILSGIQTVTGQLNIDRTKEFKDNIKNFTFYLQNNPVEASGDVYTVEEDGIHKNSSEKVDNLPLGTYYLDVAAKDQDASKYLKLEWSGGRPSFTVSKREIKVTLSFEQRATYGEAHTDWVTATASRATEGATGTWYAQNEADGETDFHIFVQSYSLQGTKGGALTSPHPNATTPADTYTVTPTWTNGNYNVQFADEQGGATFEYTINKSQLDLPSLKETAFLYTGADLRNSVKAVLDNYVAEAMKVEFYAQNDGTGDALTEIKDAGAYYVKVTLDSNYEWTSGETELYLKFMVVDRSGGFIATAADVEATYGDTGDALRPTVSGVPDRGNVYYFYTYEGIGDTVYPVSTHAPVNVGEYLVTVAVVYMGDGNSDPFIVTATAKLTIIPRELSFSLDPTEGTGGLVKAVFKNSSGETVALAANDYTLSYSLNGVAVESMTVAGEYTITVTLVGDAAKNNTLANNTAVYKLTQGVTGGGDDGGDDGDDDDDDNNLELILFSELTVEYDGEEHSILVDGNLPSGVTVTYEGNQKTEPGVYSVTAIFKNAENTEIARKTATLTITKKKYDMSGVKFEDKTFQYDGAAHEILIEGNLPSGVHVSYSGNGRTEAGVYTVTATFTVDDTAHYEVPASMTANLTIEGSEHRLHGITFESETVKYDGKTHSLAIKGTLESGVSVTYEGNGKTEPGTYLVTASFSDASGTFATMTAMLTITKATYNMSGVKFEDKTFQYDGKSHEILIQGNLPAGVQVSYSGNGRTEAGVYTVTATFTFEDTEHYEAIAPMTATLTIEEGGHDLAGITFESETVKYDGKTHSLAIKGTLGEGITVTYEGNGKTDVGVYTVTAIFSDNNGEFARKQATLTILRTQFNGRIEGSFDYDPANPDLIVEFADGIDPTWEVRIEKSQTVQKYDRVGEKEVVLAAYTLKFYKNGVEVPFDGEVKVRLRAPRELRKTVFNLFREGDGKIEAMEFTQDGQYAMFTAHGTSTYIFTHPYTSLVPAICIVSGLLVLMLIATAVLAVVYKKKNNKGE